MEKFGTVSDFFSMEDCSERVAIFGSDDLLVPDRVGQLMPIPDIERAVGAYGRARSHLEVHDVGTVCAHSSLETSHGRRGDGGSCTVGRKTAQYPPADQLNRRRDPDVFPSVEDVAWAHTVEEDV